MSKFKKNVIRAIRKSAHLSYRVSEKSANFSAKVEDKTTRLITGKDFSDSLEPTMAVEKVIFNGIEHNIAPLNPALPAVGRKGKVTLLIPSLNKRSFFGGTATALILAGKLAIRLGRPLRIVETLESGGKEGLGDFLQENGINLPDEIELIDVSARTYNIYGYLDLHPDDVLIASAWWDAKLLSQLPLKKDFIYLIQDYEPIFYSNSDEYVFAEETYHSNNFIPVLNTELMYKFMCFKGYEYIKDNGVWFEPAVSRLKHGKSIENIEKRRIFLYGRPSVDRNLFYTAVSALNHVFDSEGVQANEWEIYMAGQDKLPSIRLSTGVKITNLGKMSMDEYSDFIKTVDVALSPMMAPHPNYPTLEFASVGAVVVSTKYRTKQILSMYSKNIIMCELSVDDMAKALLKAISIPYDARMNNLVSNNINDNWDKALVGTINTVASKLRD